MDLVLKREKLRKLALEMDYLRRSATSIKITKKSQTPPLGTKCKQCN